ncbi:peptide chain release factor N(5)-glutamine methyltransferase [bacterium]|nr:peptide chain release factor N(5)-glutamine methyltransferase [bacterium]
MNQPQPNPNSNRLVDLLLLGSSYLEGKGVEDARLEAELLLGNLLDLDRVGLYLHFDRPLNDEEKTSFRERLRQRANGTPVQYLLGKSEFYGITLKVGPGVLIPRPETELLIDLAKNHAPKGGFERGCDIGCGSGAIALALLEEGIVHEMVAVDLSSAALRTTLDNARALGFSDQSKVNGQLHLTRTHNEIPQRLTILKADAFAKGFTPPGAPFNIIVSNPPYVRMDELDELDTHVRDHEPAEALVSGEDGLDAHRALAAALSGWLTPDGLFLGEFGSSQGKATLALHKTWARNAELHRDLNGHDRVVKAWLGRAR